MIFIISISIIIYFIIRYIFNGPKTPYMKNMAGKTVIITGSSDGIGKETAKELLSSGATVILACRDKNKTQRLLDTINNSKAIFMQLDLSSFKSVINFVHNYRKQFGKIDILINNAGVFPSEYILTEDGIETSFQVNHLSHTLLTFLLSDLLHDGLVLNVSSDAHKFVKELNENFLNEFSWFKSYGISKLGNIFLSRRLNKHGIESANIHPGGVMTDITKLGERKWYYKLIYYVFMLPLMLLFFKDENMGAQTTLHCCYVDNLVPNGYYADCKMIKNFDSDYNEKFEEIIMNLTKDLLINSKVYSELDSKEKELVKNFIN
jgi:retinol dehydrogenase-12